MHGIKEVEVMIHFEDYVFTSRKYFASIFVRDEFEPLHVLEGSTLRNCLLALRSKLDEMKIEYKNAHIYAEENFDGFTEEDEIAWATPLKDLEPDWHEFAIRYAERYGIIEYTVQGRHIVYESPVWEGDKWTNRKYVVDLSEWADKSCPTWIVREATEKECMQ